MKTSTRHRPIVALSLCALRRSRRRHALKKVDHNEQYVLGPAYTRRKRSKGVVTQNTSGKRAKTSRAQFTYGLCSGQYEERRPAACWCQDGLQYSAPLVFDNLTRRKQMPVTSGIFITPGTSPPKPGEPEEKG